MSPRCGSVRAAASRAAVVALAACLLPLLVVSSASAHPGYPQDPDAPTTTPPPEIESLDKIPRTTADEPPLIPTPQGRCGPGAWEETGIQGRVSREDHEKGLAARGFRCNTELVGSFTQPDTIGSVGGYKVFRYEDEAGNECAYYDTTLLPGTNIADRTAGVRVLDMADPSKPKLTATLVTPAMISPHESLIINERRGVLAAVAGNLSQALLPGIVDLYDISEDCRQPVVKSSTPTGILGHESGMAPDGNTFYSASFSTETIVAVDISNLSAPVPIWFGDYNSHGMSLSADGTRAYLAQNPDGLMILDTTEVQERVPNPTVPQISFLTWEGISIPQNTIPVEINGQSFVIESDEFGAQVQTGGARIIDISDETSPQVISNMRLDVHQKKNFDAQADDPGVNTPFQFAQGYTGHFCSVPTLVDPPIVACGMSVSGLRIFDIRDPYKPREIAYYNAPVMERIEPEGSNWAYSAPTFSPDRKEVWYSDAYSGFYAVKLTNGVWPDSNKDGKCNGRLAAILHGSGAGERLNGLKARDSISARGGADRVHGRGNGDCLDGGAGADKLKGGRGNDRLRGGGGADVLRGGNGDDTLKGAGGDDRLHGAEGNDVLRGGRGDDILDTGRGRSRVVCGGGFDVAITQPGDRVHRSCETVRELGSRRISGQA